MKTGSATTALSRASEAAWPPPPDAAATARRIIGEEFRDGLLFWRGDPYFWTGTWWQRLPHGELKASVWGALEYARYTHGDGLRPWHPNRRRVADVMEAMASIFMLTGSAEPPCWLREASGQAPASEFIPFANGLLHVPTRRLHPQDKNTLSNVTAPLPFNYNPNARGEPLGAIPLRPVSPRTNRPCKPFKNGSATPCPEKPVTRKSYCCSARSARARERLLRVLTALVGRDFVTSPTLASLASDFGLELLVGKSLALIPDARVARGDRSAVEHLLSISGEDSVSIRRKYRDAWEGHLGVRFVLATNEVPEFQDISGALVARFIPVELPVSFFDREDPDLTTKLLQELPYIANWALDGLDRLNERGRFEVPESGREALETMADLASPVHAFVRERCITSGETLVEDLWTNWKDWCISTGSNPGTKPQFGRNLRASFGVSRHRPARTWAGTGLSRDCVTGRGPLTAGLRR